MNHMGKQADMNEARHKTSRFCKNFRINFVTIIQQEVFSNDIVFNFVIIIIIFM